MDQPNGEQIDTGNEPNEQNQMVGNEMVGADTSTSPYQDDSASAMANDPMDGMPAMEPAVAPELPVETPEQHEQAIEVAEEQVEEAHPLAASDELADVASELQAMESQNFDADAPQSNYGGTDPMEQIQQEAAAAETQPVDMQPPAEEPVAQEVVVESFTEPAVEEPVEQPSVVPVAEVVVEEPKAEEVEVAEPSAPETSPAMSSAQVGGQMINDVIAPSATASAIALGTAGTNAITGTPETTSTADAIASGSAPKPEKEKSKKGLLVAIVLIVTLLFGGAAVAAYMSSSSKDTEETTNTETSQTENEPVATTPTAVPGEEAEAMTLDDYKVACGSGKVLNAKAYDGAGVHQIVMFEKGSDDKYAQNILPFKDKTWTAVATDITAPQLVGCIARDSTKDTKLKSCPITDPATKVTVNVDYYSSTYTVNVHEAASGKLVGTFTTASTDTECPTTAAYNKADPKIFALYDVESIETSLKSYVTAAL